MRKIVLKKLITRRNKPFVIFLLLIFFILFYDFTSAYSFSHGRPLALLEIDKAIPLLPWTIWIYSLVYPLYLLWCFWNFRDEAELNKTVYGFLNLTIVSGFCFILYPVTFPREAFATTETESLSYQMLLFIRSTDRPSNCLPSLHVGYCYLFAFGFLRTDRQKAHAGILVSSLIAVSTLTTKQHYLVDVVAGMILGILVYAGVDLGTRVEGQPSQR